MEVSGALDAALSELTERARRLGIAIEVEQLDLLRLYCQELAVYNAHTNLVSDASARTVALEHLLDSLTLVAPIRRFIESNRAKAKSVRLIDIGSGAGLPGAILAIVVKQLHVLTVDSVGKKVKFVQQFAQRAKLEARLQAIAGRAEELAHQAQYRERFELATARAVGSVEIIAELTMPFLTQSGELYLQKSLSQLDESSQAASLCLPKLGGALRDATVLDTSILAKERAIIVAEKRFKTPSKYPRPWAQMKTSPLGQ